MTVVYCEYQEIRTYPEERVRAAKKRFTVRLWKIEEKGEEFYRSSKAPPPKFGSKIRCVKGRSKTIAYLLDSRMCKFVLKGKPTMDAIIY